jgi:hypothetical protein
MPLVTSQGYDLVADPGAALQLGKQRDIQNKLSGLALQGEQLGLQSQQESRQGERDVAAAEAMLSGALQLKGIASPRRKLEYLSQRRAEFLENGLPTQGIDTALDLARTGQWEELESQTDKLINMGQGRGRVQSSTQLPGGLVQQVMSDGSVRVVDASGRQLTGQEAQQAIQEAEERGIELAGEKAGGRVSSVEIAKRQQGILGETLSTVRSAPVAINKLEKLSDVFAKADTGTGQAFLSSLGKVIPGATPATLEDALSASGAFVLQNLSQIKGPITEKELAFIQTLGPSVRNSPEGNKLIVDRMIQALKDELELAKAQRSWAKEGKDPQDFDVEGFIAEKEAARDIILSGAESFDQPEEVVDPALLEFMTPEERALFDGS